MLFRTKGTRLQSLRGPRPKFLVSKEFFAESSRKKYFWGRGPTKSTILSIFSSTESRNMKKKCFSVSKLHFSRAFMGKSLQKSEKRYPCKTHFSKIGRKMSMRGPPTPIFVDWKFFYLNFVKKNFRGRGP